MSYNYRYRILTGLEVDPGRTRTVVANETLRTGSAALGIKIPKLFFIEDEQLLGTIECDSRIVGLAEPTMRSIYIVVDQPLSGIVRTVLHEVWHIFDVQNDDNRELRADAFLGRVWGSHVSKTSFVEIMTALEGIRARAGAALDSKQPVEKKTDIDAQRKLHEIRANYYSKGIAARAELFLKQKNRGYFPADIEFFNVPISLKITNGS